MRYEIKGGNMPAAVIYLENGESLSTEAGAMSWMSPNMEMETEGGGGLGKALGRAFGGEKIFRNRYTAKGGTGLIAVTSSFPGAIKAVEITPDKPIVIQKTAFLACTAGVDTQIFFQKKFGAGLLGGEGFIMQKVSGSGIVFLEIDGSEIEYELGAGQQMIIDTGSLAMVDASCSIDVVSVKGFKNVLFGGEGLFNTVVTGPGRVSVQTMPVSQLAQALIPYLPTGGNSNH